MLQGNGASYVATFTAPYVSRHSIPGDFLTAVLCLSITSILISRFLLELQEADRKIVRLDVNDPLYSSRGWFDSTPSFISSIGAFIDPHLQTSHDADPEMRGSSGSYSNQGEDDEERGGWQATEAVPAGSSSST